MVTQNTDQQLTIPDRVPLAGGGPVTPAELRDRVRAGWRCVRFESCYSLVFVTVRRQSRVYLTERWQQRYLYGLGYSVAALLAGPWGVPWGVVWTARAVWTNLTGGVDVTDAVLDHVAEHWPAVPNESS